MINKIYIEDHNQVLDDVKSEFDIVDNWLAADAVVVWQDVRGRLINTVANANLMDKPTAVMQHGLRATRDYGKKIGKMLIANKIMVWGPKDKERILETGWVEPERVIITGTTIFDHLRPKERTDGKNVLFVPLHWDREIMENHEIAHELRKMKNINVTTKVTEDLDVSFYDNVVYSNRDDKNHLSIIADILAKTDVVVGTNESTLEFMAYYLNIPVIVVDNWRPKRLLDTWVERIDRDFSKAVERSTIDNLEKKINKVLRNPNEKKEERLKALYEEAGIGWGCSTAKERIVNTIKKLSTDLIF